MTILNFIPRNKNRLAFEAYQKKQAGLNGKQSKLDKSVADDEAKETNRSDLKDMLKRMLIDIRTFSKEHVTIQNILEQLEERGTVSDAQIRYCTKLYLQAYDEKLMKKK